MKRLQDKVAIVTGGSGGIGRAISLCLAEEGAKTFINFKSNESEAKKLALEIEKNGGSAYPVKADVTDSNQTDHMAEEVFRQCGRIDILVNNAGIVRDTLLLSMNEKDWDDVIQVNLGGVYRCTKAVAKYMTMQRSGKVINISSIAASMGGRGHANYAASKGAINAFTKSMAIELARKKITVNTVAPGVIDTDMTERVRKLAMKEILDQIPLKRIGQPWEVAKVVAFLASPDSDYITGEIINITGGMGV